MPRRLPTRVQKGRQAIQEEVGLYQKGNQDELSAGKILLGLFRPLQSVILRLEIENCDTFFFVESNRISFFYHCNQKGFKLCCRKLLLL